MPEPTRMVRSRRNAMARLVENDLIERVSFEEYRDKVRSVYGGPKGVLLATCSLVSLHEPFGKRLIKCHKFDIRGAKALLDIGSGAGQICKHLIRYSDADAKIVCADLSMPMLRRAKIRLKSDRPSFIAADLTRLPFNDDSFDCVTCGYVLEHVNPHDGFREIMRVLKPGGRLLLLATEDSFTGSWTSFLFCCRTYNRDELRAVCHEVGLVWKQELWFTPFHKAFRAGGIVVEIQKPIESHSHAVAN